MASFDVLVIGELNVDIILNDIQGFPEIGKEIRADQLNLTLGSSSAIFASNLSSLGVSVGMVGLLGNDSFADTIKKSLLDKKVNIDFVMSSDRYSTGLTIVMNYGMDRANVTFPGAMEHLTVEDITDQMLLSCKHMHLSSIFLQKGIKKHAVQLFERAKKLGITTSMDPQWDPSENWKLDLSSLLPHLDVWMPNEVEFKNITSVPELADGLEKIKEYANYVVIKDGIHGAHLWNQGNLTSKPAFLNSEVADCIGAGDSFDAGFISEFIKGSELNRCLEVGNVMGAINTLEPGGTTSFKNREYIEKIAIEKFGFTL
ncbi:MULTISPECIES: carbohydrate kinase family protein [Maribacter]|uniref:Sugar kinase n=1 Tax=Maribacter flavus TaxID=1658664 RepID=A0ABU7ILP7_9FLAO|nr:MULTISPECIES: sugar kinase [Maribacter]MDC6406618.1 sugar kinase [Maribacter sp. PR66]MEE1973736.1 sugar kinase [Maribacter flavus]